MKNNSLTDRYTVKFESPLGWGFGFCFCAVLFLYPALCLAGSEEQLQAADGELSIAESAVSEIKTAGISAVSDSYRQVEYQVRRARIASSRSDVQSPNKKSLQDIIRQVRSLKFKVYDEVVEPIIIAKFPVASEPDESLSTGQQQGGAEKISGDTQQNKSVDGGESVHDVRMLDEISQQGDQLENPFKLAEVLFRGGRFEQAALCYQQVLSRQDTELGKVPNRDWILFQLGNCLRESEPQKAAEMYKKLILEHPDSPWTSCAESQSKLIEMYLHDKPRALIRKNGSMPLAEKGA